MDKICIICFKRFSKLSNESRKYWGRKKFCSRTCCFKFKIGKQLSLPWSGKTREKETIAKISKTKLSSEKTPRGNSHFAWKGDRVGLTALHMWVRRHYGKPYKCEQEGCKYPREKNNWAKELMLKAKQYHWANISGKYKRDRRDWMMLCVSCHHKMDRLTAKQLGVSIRFLAGRKL